MLDKMSLKPGTKIANGIGSGFVSANQKHGIHRRLRANVMRTSWPYIWPLLGICPINNTARIPQNTWMWHAVRARL